MLRVSSQTFLLLIVGISNSSVDRRWHINAAIRTCSCCLLAARNINFSRYYLGVVLGTIASCAVWTVRMLTATKQRPSCDGIAPATAPVNMLTLQPIRTEGSLLHYYMTAHGLCYFHLGKQPQFLTCRVLWLCLSQPQNLTTDTHTPASVLIDLTTLMTHTHTGWKPYQFR